MRVKVYLEYQKESNCFKCLRSLKWLTVRKYCKSRTVIDDRRETTNGMEIVFVYSVTVWMCLRFNIFKFTIKEVLSKHSIA